MDLRGAVEEIPGERTCLSTTGNAEIFAIEIMLAQCAPLLFQELLGE